MKILITIITSEKHLESRLSYIEETWLKDCEDYLIVSDHNDKSRKIVKLSEDTTYEGSVEKNLRSYEYIYNNYSDFDWFLTLDDDSFLNYKNLKNYIMSLENNGVIKIGYLNKGSFSYLNFLNYHSGGAGTLYNLEALKILKNCFQNEKYRYQKINHEQSRWADVNVGLFCYDNNIEQIHCDLFNPREPKYYDYSNDEIKKQITFHYVFGETFNEINNIIK